MQASYGLLSTSLLGDQKVDCFKGKSAKMGDLVEEDGALESVAGPSKQRSTLLTVCPYILGKILQTTNWPMVVMC